MGREDWNLPSAEPIYCKSNINMNRACIHAYQVPISVLKLFPLCEASPWDVWNAHIFHSPIDTVSEPLFSDPNT